MVNKTTIIIGILDLKWFKRIYLGAKLYKYKN
jgi:hypothetical protein